MALSRTLLPLQITLRNIGPSIALEALIRDRAQKLQGFHSHLVHCRVTVEPAGHRHHGKQFVVRIDLKVPGADINVGRQHDEDPRVAVRDAFDAARRQLEDHVRVQRGDVKARRA